MLADVKKHSIFVALYYAKVAQLVERQPSKLNVASSNLVFRSKSLIRNNKALFLANSKINSRFKRTFFLVIKLLIYLRITATI